MNFSQSQDDGVFSGFVNDYIELFKKVEPDLYQYIMKIEPNFPSIPRTKITRTLTSYLSPKNNNFYDYLITFKQFIDDARIEKEKETKVLPQIKQSIIDYKSLIIHTVDRIQNILIKIKRKGISTQRIENLHRHILRKLDKYDNLEEILIQIQLLEKIELNSHIERNLEKYIQELVNIPKEIKLSPRITSIPITDLEPDQLFHLPPINIKVDDCGESMVKPEATMSYSFGTWNNYSAHPNTIIFDNFPNGIQLGSKVTHTSGRIGPQKDAIIISIDPINPKIVTFSEPFNDINDISNMIELCFITIIESEIVKSISLEEKQRIESKPRRVVRRNGICFIGE